MAVTVSSWVFDARTQCLIQFTIIIIQQNVWRCYDDLMTAHCGQECLLPMFQVPLTVQSWPKNTEDHHFHRISHLHTTAMKHACFTHHLISNFSSIACEVVMSDSIALILHTIILATRRYKCQLRACGPVIVSLEDATTCIMQNKSEHDERNKRI